MTAIETETCKSLYSFAHFVAANLIHIALEYVEIMTRELWSFHLG